MSATAASDSAIADSDGDGIKDNIDEDDDNDGISDAIEEQACAAIASSTITEFIFLNETFGAGTGRASMSSSDYDVYTGYCFEDNETTTSSDPNACNDSNSSVNDGEYTLTNHITNGNNSEPVGPSGSVATWAWHAWDPITDHTGDTNGRMALFNADNKGEVFYRTKINGLISGVLLEYSYWAVNVDNVTPGRLQPNITVNFYYESDLTTPVSTYAPGKIFRCPSGMDDCDKLLRWREFKHSFTPIETTIVVEFVNNEDSGGGNDLAIDDIVIKQSLCDLDGDSIADVYDLDSDNDGIPDVVEASIATDPTFDTATMSNGKGHLTGMTGWTDANNNGLLDSLEYLTYTDFLNHPWRDADGDGVPNYLDLDSDNDGLFDVDESGATNTHDTSFYNGDGDSNGDGIGDGIDSETFRGNAPGYGDGILDVFDFQEGNTSLTDSYGNDGQENPISTFGDPNIPDYLEVNPLATNDPRLIYANLLDGNGKLTDNTDADEDGVMDSLDGDSSLFGSPRDINGSHSLYFDGRNDYIEDDTVDFPAGSGGTIMAFVKYGGANTNNGFQIIAGKNNFYLRIDTDHTIRAFIGANNLQSTTTLKEGLWTHITCTTKVGETKLYINGVEEASTTSFGGVDNSGNFMIGSSTIVSPATEPTFFYKGEIDEVRVFNEALSPIHIKSSIYQELDESTFSKGSVLTSLFPDPTDYASSIIKYYKFDNYTDDILENLVSSTNPSGAKMHHFKTIYNQTAPLPYVTTTSASGNWSDPKTWLHGDVWDIHTKSGNKDDASIVKISHDVTLDGSYDVQGTAGIYIDPGATLTVPASKGLYTSFAVDLYGTLDLQGESQLIETEHSNITNASNGVLKHAQQGASSMYEYNYWSSPVGSVSSNAATNTSYSVEGVISNVNFTTDINGSAGTISEYWLYSYPNKPADNIYHWVHAGKSGALSAGEGFTMKGTDAVQDYNFEGIPFSGNIPGLILDVDNEYLIGNPYPSAIDAHAFIDDNIADGGNNSDNIINGALYFWDHISTNTHYTREYEGGYSIVTKTGETQAFSNDSRINATGAPGKIAKRYIPVGQGFFVSTVLDGTGSVTTIKGGNIVFKNSQRIFVTEGSGNSEFLKATSKKSTSTSYIDTRAKIRLALHSPESYNRQLLLGTDEGASINFDIGFEAPLIENHKEDMYWLLDDVKLVIQAVKDFEDPDLKLPLGIKVSTEGLVTLKIDALEYVDAKTEVYLFDNILNTYHDLRASDFEIHLSPGEYHDRFVMTFSKDAALHSDESTFDKDLHIYFNNQKNCVVLRNPNLKAVKTIGLFNILGQPVQHFEIDNENTYNIFKTRNLNSGAYIVKLQTAQGIVSKKILVE
ncbi:LamG-like jellyroll fold domain-containing protein [Pseudotamlana carrageenivorans]|nr:LamG-like jellyroll fold domain-containing protein [Tamlana carrageenivorans]